MKTRILLMCLLAIGLQSYAQQVTISKKAASFQVKGADSTVLILLNGDKITEANMQALATDKIESLSVLKDATATATYGAAGKNGVILIKTKGTNELNKVNAFKLNNPSGNSPLYVLDGVKMDKTAVEAISPDDISSINILKGSRGIVIYGAEAVNGVVEIVTKTSKKTEKK